MKKRKQFAALMLSMCMLMSLSACGSQPSGTEGKIPEPENTQQAPSKPAEAPDLPEHHDPKEPAVEVVPPATPVDHGGATTLALQKQLHALYDWDDTSLLVRSEFSPVTMWYEDAAKYPKLAETLNQTANMVKRSMEDEYDNLCATAREELLWAGENIETSVSTLDIQVRRADSVVLSLLSDSYSDYGWIEDFRGMHGTNYDTQTGQELAVTDVVNINQTLAEAVASELNSHQWAGDYDYLTAVEEYFVNTPTDGISWTLDYNGVTFYFGDGDLEEPGNGRKTATVSFAQHPELFAEKYMVIPDAYMVELPMDSSFFTDLDGDGDLEELNITGYFDGGVGMYTKFGIYTDTNGSYNYEDCYADGFIPYYVKTADGNHYLYLFCEQNEGSGPIPMMLLVVFDLKDGILTKIGELNAAPGFIPPDVYRLPTNPEGFYLDDFDSMAQDMLPFAVGKAGMPEPKE